MMFLFTNQRGALFGMDARIALIAMGVLALGIGTMRLTRVNEGKVFLAEQRLLDYKRSYLSAWVTEGSSYAASPTDVLSSLASSYGDKTLGTDPWGNAYLFHAVPVVKSIDGQNVTIYFHTMHTTGTDGTDDTFHITTEAEYNTWAPAGDDIGLKFSTYDITLKALDDARQRLNAITTRLQAYEKQTLETVRAYCDVLANQLTTTCDFDDNATYTTDEEFSMNLFPRATGESTASKYYIPGTTYTSGDLTGMQNLMTLIGADTSYAQDLLGRTLNYTSNTTGVATAPFSARVWYQ